jgi:hypothetical protein
MGFKKSIEYFETDKKQLMILKASQYGEKNMHLKTIYEFYHIR